MTLRHHRNIPFDVRVLSYGTATRWIGWGFCEALIPVLAYKLTGNYGEAGLLNSIGNLVFMLLFPISGAILARFDLKKFLLVGLLFFIGAGVGYTMAAITGAVTFFVLAYIFDGIGVIADVVGRATWLRIGRQRNMATLFGFMGSVTNFGQLFGILLGGLFVTAIGLRWMFVIIVPTTCVTMFIFWRHLEPRPPIKSNLRSARPFSRAYSEIGKSFAVIIRWSTEAKGVLFLVFCSYVFGAVVTFFLPIYIYQTDADLRQVLFSTAVVTVPLTFSFGLGRLIEGRERRALSFALLMAAIILGVLGTIEHELLQLAMMFSLSLALVVVVLAGDALITAMTNSEQYANASAFTEAAKELGLLIGPVVVGFLMDIGGRLHLFVSLAIAALIIAFLVVRANSDDLITTKSYYVD